MAIFMSSGLYREGIRVLPAGAFGRNRVIPLREHFYWKAKKAECMTNPRVTLLIPVCNVESYLEECLLSAQNQTLNNIEIIVINDGSTDHSLDIIKKFAAADNRFKVIDKPNSGYGDSMNKGLDAATGTYIAILESDDILDPEALEYMANEADEKCLDVFKCNFWFYWSKPTEANAYRENYYFPALSPEMISMGVHRPIDQPQIFSAKASIWSALYRRDFINENGIRFLPTPGASFQDASFTFKVFACATRVAYSGRAFLHYRQDNEGSSVNSRGKVYCVCDEHAEMKRFLNEDRPDLKKQLDLVRAHQKVLNYNWNLDRLADGFKREFLQRYREELLEEIADGNIPDHVSEDVLPWSYEGICYFTPKEFENVQEIVNDPDFYLAHRECEQHSSGKSDTFSRYFKAGGIPYVMRALKKRK